MNNRQRIVLTRLVLGSILFFLLMRWAEKVTLSGLSAPPMFNVNLDFTYWLYKWSGLPGFLTGNKIIAVLFDSFLFLTGILSFLFPLHRKWIIPFSILLFFYALTYDLYATHSFAQVIGFIVVLLPFWITSTDKFFLAWQGIRYFTCLIYTLAFTWKTWFNNSFYYGQQGINSLKANMVDYMYLNPDSLMTGFYKWCIRHEALINGGEKFIIILEGLMVIGFFTKKYDRLLIWIPVLIHLATYLFADVFFFELLVIDLSFLSVSQLDRIGNCFTIFSLSKRRRRENILR